MVFITCHVCIHFNLVGGFSGRTALMCAMMAGHHSMREVFAKAPTRASWDVHPGSHSMYIFIYLTTHIFLLNVITA